MPHSSEGSGGPVRAVPARDDAERDIIISSVGVHSAQNLKKRTLIYK